MRYRLILDVISVVRGRCIALKRRRRLRSVENIALYLNFVFFQSGVFLVLCGFFLIWFFESLSIFTRNHTFCEHTGLLKVFDTMRLFFSKKRLEALFFSLFRFLRSLQLIKELFQKKNYFVVSSWRKSGF